MKSGLAWSASSTAIRQAVQFATLAVLARILDPSDYGLVALSGVVVGLGAVLSDSSLGSALVQRSRISREHILTSYWVTAGIGRDIVKCCGCN